MKTKEGKKRQCLECGVNFASNREIDLCYICRPIDDKLAWCFAREEMEMEEEDFIVLAQRLFDAETLEEKIIIKKLIRQTSAYQNELKSLKECLVSTGETPTPAHQNELKRLKNLLVATTMKAENRDAFQEEKINLQEDAIESLNDVIFAMTKKTKKFKKKNKKLKKENDNLKVMMNDVIFAMTKKSKKFKKKNKKLKKENDNLKVIIKNL